MTRKPNKETFSWETKFTFITQLENRENALNFINFGLAHLKFPPCYQSLYYEITRMSHKKQVVHVNRLNMAFDLKIWKPKPETSKKRKNQEAGKPEEQEEENEMRIGPLPLLNRGRLLEGLELPTPQNQVPHTPAPNSQTTVSPHSERRDPSYEAPHTPRSRRELRTVRPEPPLTRSRTRFQTQDPNMSEASASANQTQVTPPVDMTADGATSNCPT